ncbi:S-layer homology domain-containing protein, partial [Patescibacteria group bacterium]|nr:S-layer homology domain-containing protein [Patescibacteria group bacterium]
MKKKLLSILVLTLLMIMTGIASATGTSSSWDPVTYDDSISFSAVVQSDGSVKTTWNKYSHAEEFSYYKVVRSQENSNPVYPDDGYIYVGSDVTGLSYTDYDVPVGKNYYRVCHVASPKRYCSTTVVAVEGTTVVAAEETESATVEMVEGFGDVPTDHWVADCVAELGGDGIVQSGEGIFFRPASSVNRAEFLKLVMKTYYQDSVAGAASGCFKDVIGSTWYAPYICAAKESGIVEGYTDGTYGPARNITRAEGAAILVKALHVPIVEDATAPFKDVTTDWQKIVVNMAYGRGLIKGYNPTEFGPNDQLLRAQAAQLICNARDNFAAPLEGAVPVIPANVSATAINRSAPVIINHINTDIGKVPDSYVESAKAMFRIAYGHTSHGSQISTGIDVLEGQNSVYASSGDGSGGTLYFNENILYGDLGGNFETQTRELLNANTSNINMVMWSWCGQLSSMTEAQVDDYLTKMDQLENDFADVVFV